MLYFKYTLKKTFEIKKEYLKTRMIDVRASNAQTLEKYTKKIQTTKRSARNEKF